MNSGTGHTSTTTNEPGKVRLYEVAKDLGLANKDLVAKVRALGIEVKNHMSNLDVEDVARVKRALDKERQANLVEERLSSTVIRRRSRDGGTGPAVTRSPVSAAPSAEPSAGQRPAAPSMPPPAPIDMRGHEEEAPAPSRRIVVETPSAGEAQPRTEDGPTVLEPVHPDRL